MFMFTQQSNINTQSQLVNRQAPMLEFWTDKQERLKKTMKYINPGLRRSIEVCTYGLQETKDYVELQVVT